MSSNENDSKKITEPGQRALAHGVYALFATAWILGVSAVKISPVLFIIAVIIAHSRARTSQSTLARDHFRWQVRTFWWTTLLSIPSGLIVLYALGQDHGSSSAVSRYDLVDVGVSLLIVPIFWSVYRIAKGWMNLTEGSYLTVPRAIGDKLDLGPGQYVADKVLKK